MPLIKDDLSLSKYTMGSMTSETSPNRFIGILSKSGWAFAGSDQFSRPIFVRITVGFTLLTRIDRPSAPNSSDNDLVSMSTPALEMLYALCPWKARELAREDTLTILPPPRICGMRD